MNKKQGTGRAAWAARALALVLLLAAWAPSARGEAEIRYVLQGMGMLAPVNNTHYLLAQSAGNKRWGVVDTDGAQLTDFAFERLSYNAFTCFQDSLDEDPLMNWKALDTLRNTPNTLPCGLTLPRSRKHSLNLPQSSPRQPPRAASR